MYRQFASLPVKKEHGNNFVQLSAVQTVLTVRCYSLVSQPMPTMEIKKMSG